MAVAIGIDLGTTNSCAAIMVSGKPRVITVNDGATQVPSVFAIDSDGNEIVGSAARNQAQSNPDGTVIAAKRLIGRNFHSKAAEKYAVKTKAQEEAEKLAADPAYREKKEKEEKEAAERRAIAREAYLMRQRQKDATKQTAGK